AGATMGRLCGGFGVLDQALREALGRSASRTRSSELGGGASYAACAAALGGGNVGAARGSSTAGIADDEARALGETAATTGTDGDEADTTRTWPWGGWTLAAPPAAFEPGAFQPGALEPGALA